MAYLDIFGSEGCTDDLEVRERKGWTWILRMRSICIATC